MGGKSGGGGGSSAPKDPFPYTQPEVFYDPEAGMYYALKVTGKGKNQKTQRTTNFSMIPILNQEAMKAEENIYVPTLAEMFPTLQSPLAPSALLDAQNAVNPNAGAGAGRFLGLLGNAPTQS